MSLLDLKVHIYSTIPWEELPKVASWAITSLGGEDLPVLGRRSNHIPPPQAPQVPEPTRTWTNLAPQVSHL